MSNFKKVSIVLFLIITTIGAGIYFWLEKQSISLSEIGPNAVLVILKNNAIEMKDLEIEFNAKLSPIINGRIKNLQKGHLVIIAKVLNNEWGKFSSPKPFMIYSDEVGFDEIKKMKPKLQHLKRYYIEKNQSLALFALFCPGQQKCVPSADGNIFARALIGKVKDRSFTVDLLFDMIMETPEKKNRDIYFSANAKINGQEMSKIATNWLAAILPMPSKQAFGSFYAENINANSGTIFSNEIIAIAGPFQISSDNIKLNFSATSVNFPKFKEPIIVKLIPCDVTDGDIYNCISLAGNLGREKFKTYNLLNIKNGSALFPYSSEIYELQAMDW